jgi:uncharacterized protein YecT (DUF1311 family)
MPTKTRIAAITAILLAALAAGPALAGQDAAAAAPADPIDTALAACLDGPDGQSTAGMIECLDTAYDAWDAALNETYAALAASLDPKSRGLLKRSQRQWIAFRNAERQFFAAPWTTDRGTLVRVTLGQAQVDLVKGRVLMLRSYLEP